MEVAEQGTLNRSPRRPSDGSLDEATQEVGSFEKDEQSLDDGQCKEEFDQQCVQWVEDLVVDAKYAKVIKVPQASVMEDQGDDESEDFPACDVEDIVAFCIHAIELPESYGTHEN